MVVATSSKKALNRARKHGPRHTVRVFRVPHPRTPTAWIYLALTTPHGATGWVFGACREWHEDAVESCMGWLSDRHPDGLPVDVIGDV